MKKVLAQYSAYNLWANQRMVDAVINLTDTQITMPVNSSFPSIFLTMAHLWDVEAVWWQRMKLQENVEWPSKSFTGSIMEIGKNLVQQSKQWKEWIELGTDAALEHEFIYKNSKKEQFKQPVYEAVHHLFNHQTFHRGQLITMLRIAGCDKIPNTDQIAFLRKK